MSFSVVACFVLAIAGCLYGQDLQITEFMAVNSASLRDEDREFNDWIEIHNPRSSPASVSGWYLTDDPTRLTQWMFPAVDIPGNGYLVVFASGKDRRIAAGTLHTNFKLDRDGEYLALIQPDGKTVAAEFAPAYPNQLSDVSYGRSMTVLTEELLQPNALARMLLPIDNWLGMSWVQPAFDDATWAPVVLGVGYDRTGAGETNSVEPPASMDVSQPDDFIVATSSNSPGNEGVENAIDNKTQTKYLNFDKLNAGLTVTPSAGISVITGLRLTSANDAPERDPTSYVLLGSIDGEAFTEISRGGIPMFSGRFVAVQVGFSNSQAYLTYRLLFPTVRDASSAVAVQIAEVEFLGWVGASLPQIADHVRTDIEPVMFGLHSSAFLRIPFVIDEIRPRDNLSLRLFFDDGFIAFLNGTEIARANAPAAPAADSTALANRPREEVVRETCFDVSHHANLLQLGANILAVQVFNDHADSPDFLFDARLENTRITWGDLGYCAAPTPGRTNTITLAGLAADVLFDHGHGFYEAPIDVGLYCPTPDTVIRYTTNGSVPAATNGLLFEHPLRLSRTTVLRAAAFREGWHPSKTSTRTFIFLDDVIAQDRSSALALGFPVVWGTQAADYGLDSRVVGPGGSDQFGGKYARSIQSSLRSLPSISIVMDTRDLFGPQGIYAYPENRGAAWERAASIEWIDPNGNEGFQADAGVRIQGGAFRRFDLTLKKSFRLVFREQYGDSWLKYPLFGPNAADRFDNIILRANSNDAWPYGGGNALYARDTFALETALAMGMVASHSGFAHLYLNGCYWGLYNPVERPDAAFSATYYGGAKDTWDAINQDSVPDGTYDAWNRMQSMLNLGLSDNTLYQKIQGNNPDGSRNLDFEDLLDIDSLIDYIILNIYIGNVDWPGRNWWVGRNRDQGDGFKFYPWDSETALGLSGLSANVTGADSAVARPYAVARSNAEFRLKFADHVQRHFFNGGALYVNPTSPKWDPAHPEHNVPAARFYTLSEKIKEAMVGESARWGDQRNTSLMTRDEHWLKARDGLLANYFPQRSQIVLSQLRQANLFPGTSAPIITPHGGHVPKGFQVTMSADQGSIYFTTNGTDPRAPLTGALNRSWLYTAPVTLTNLTTIRARTRNGQEWSPLAEATFIVGNPILAVSELSYHPSPPTEAEQLAGFDDAGDFEFIELCNPGDGTFDLTGARFSDGIQFNFSGSAITKLVPGKYLLVVKNRAAFELRYGVGHPIAGEYSGKLDNAGERIEIVDARDSVILEFAYSTQSPWLKAADGRGPTLEAINPEGNLNSPSNWRISQVLGGSPGAVNPVIPIELMEVAHNRGQLQFGFAGSAWTSYMIQFCSSLAADSWLDYQRIDPATSNQLIQVTINLATNIGPGFFRVTRP